MQGFRKVIAALAVCDTGTKAMDIFRHRFKRQAKKAKENTYADSQRQKVHYAISRADNIELSPFRVVMGLDRKFTPMNNILSTKQRRVNKFSLLGLDKAVVKFIGSFLVNTKEIMIDAGSVITFAAHGNTSDRFRFENLDNETIDIFFGDTGKVIYVDYNRTRYNAPVYTVELDYGRGTYRYGQHVNVLKNDLANGFQLKNFTNPYDIYQNEIRNVESFNTLRLHDAIRDGDSKTVEALIRVGANVNYKDPDKETPYDKLPLELAFIVEVMNTRGPDIVRLLEKEGAKLPE